jgi:hypothetical protein
MCTGYIEVMGMNETFAGLAFAPTLAHYAVGVLLVWACWLVRIAMR